MYNLAVLAKNISTCFHTILFPGWPLRHQTYTVCNNPPITTLVLIFILKLPFSCSKSLSISLPFPDWPLKQSVRLVKHCDPSGRCCPRPCNTSWPCVSRPITSVSTQCQRRTAMLLSPLCRWGPSPQTYRNACHHPQLFPISLMSITAFLFWLFSLLHLTF